jgi:uncharacterized protein (TIGR02453 family)
MNFPIIFKFLKALAKNNNREWFEKHKGEYLEAKDEFELFVTNLLHDMVKFEPALASLNPKKLTFRIYRDVRFSKDKRPYKTNMGATFSPGGKLMTSPGYYVHIEPGNKSFVAGGLYMPPPEHLTKIRQEIDYDPKGLEKILTEKKFKKLYKGFDEFDKLKTAPKGFAKDHPHLEWLKLKSFIATTYFSDADVTSKTFLKKTSEACQVMKPLNDYLAEAIS